MPYFTEAQDIPPVERMPHIPLEWLHYRIPAMTFDEKEEWELKNERSWNFTMTLVQKARLENKFKDQAELENALLVEEAEYRKRQESERQEWNQFISGTQPGDVLWWYTSIKVDPFGPGSSGYAILRGSTVIAVNQRHIINSAGT